VPSYNSYLTGIEEGFGWYGVGVEHQLRGRRLYCQPDGLSLTTPQIIDIVKRWVAKNPTHNGGLPIGYALLQALIDTFPCKTN
jgi:hypothetical protein